MAVVMFAVSTPIMRLFRREDIPFNSFTTITTITCVSTKVSRSATGWANCSP